MKTLLSLMLVLIIAFSLCACGKTDPVKKTEALIAAIGAVTSGSGEAIALAEDAYNALTSEEKSLVKNADALSDAKLSYIMCLVDEIGGVSAQSEADILIDETVPAEPICEETLVVEHTQSSEVLIASGSCADSITWTLDEYGTLTLSGTGSIPDYEKGAGNQPWMNYWKSITALIVEDGITRIGDRAFQSCRYIESAFIGNDVASIGEWAFQNCYALTNVELLPHVNLETGAFRSTPVEWEISALGSALYDSSSYSSALSQVVLTGDYREDIIRIARSQVGYHEGDSEADYAGGNTNGSKDYTEYGRRMDSVGTAWCSEFASWCIRMAGVPTDIIASSRSANIVNFTKNTSATWYTWYDISYYGGNYTPRKGDIILWLWDGDTYSTEENLSHTSIFWETESQENGKVVLKTIDGNSSNQVRVRSYEVDPEEGTLIGRKGRLCYIIAPDYESGKE